MRVNEGARCLAPFWFQQDDYFHAHFRRENPTEMQKDFEILPRTMGKGRFLGANLGMQGNRKLY